MRDRKVQSLAHNIFRLAAGLQFAPLKARQVLAAAVSCLSFFDADVRACGNSMVPNRLPTMFQADHKLTESFQLQQDRHARICAIKTNR